MRTVGTGKWLGIASMDGPKKENTQPPESHPTAAEKVNTPHVEKI
jgi:hypothetical protein